MAATTESVRADAAEAPLLNKKNMILGSLLSIAVRYVGLLGSLHACIDTQWRYAVCPQ